jgi:hypothetical protein
MSTEWQEHLTGICMARDKSRGQKWDGKSRVSNDLYRKNYDDIFKKEQDELKESYEQSLRNKKEREK